MDFLDIQFASVERAQYAGFLGIGNNKKKAESSNQGFADLENRFPFSNVCEDQKKIIAALNAESAQLLATRNSAKGSTRTQLTGRLRAYDAYVASAIAHMNNVSCLVKPASANDAGQNVILADQVNAANTIGSKKKTYLLVGIGIVVLLGAVVLVRRKLKK